MQNGSGPAPPRQNILDLYNDQIQLYVCSERDGILLTGQLAIYTSLEFLSAS